jgi:hypothetical protein
MSNEFMGNIKDVMIGEKKEVVVIQMLENNVCPTLACGEDAEVTQMMKVVDPEANGVLIGIEYKENYQA